ERGDEPKNASGGFERAANDDAPVAAGEVLEHEQAERTERKAEYGKEGHQIGGKEIHGRHDRANNATNDAEDTDYESALFKARYAFRRFVVLRGHSLAPSDFAPPFSAAALEIFARSDSGRSLALALRLNCRARTYATMAQ